MKDLAEYYKNNLKGVEVRDKVFDLAFGYGIVKSIKMDVTYCLVVSFDLNDGLTYTTNGRSSLHPIPTLFFNKPNYDEDGYPIPQQKEEKIDFVKWMNENGLCLGCDCEYDIEKNVELWEAAIYRNGEQLSLMYYGDGRISVLNKLISGIEGIIILPNSGGKINVPSNFALIKEE